MTTDQGSQVTSFAWTGRLKRTGRRISLDGKGVCRADATPLARRSLLTIGSVAQFIMRSGFPSPWTESCHALRLGHSARGEAVRGADLKPDDLAVEVA